MELYLNRPRNTGWKAALASTAMVAALPAGQATAATDGSLGATSTGTVAISASVPTRARISGLSDVAFTNQDPSTAAASAQDVCVWSNTTTKAYTITATGSGTASAFTLTNGSGTVPYSVEWAGTSGATSGTALVAGTASGSQTSAATNQICASGPVASASLVVKMATADLGTMTGGSSYTGALTLLITPQ
jgi:hypothetical protein